MEEAVVTTAAAYGWKAFLHQRLRWAGKMHAVSATVMMVGLLSMSLPWLLLVQSMHFQLSHLLEEHGIEMVALLCVSWLLWLVPSVALVMEAKRFLGQRRSFLIAALCYMVFMVYSPMIALLAKVMPTQWKGRPVRT
jgi:cellulose synthase/poly-beta-1,6-N-acetylglucosamine synthase-like glycosyltransferase